jgi:hypothetical protein
MAEAVQLNPFAKRYAASFPRSTHFSIDTNGSQLEATNTRDFISSRGLLMDGLLSGNTKHEQMAHALLAENTVELALQPVLKDEFKARLAPQSLEWSRDGNKGVDILISDSEDYVYLGIDVKLHENRSPRGRDGFGWNDRLKTPFVFLALGNWSVDIQEREEVKVKDWLRYYTIPHLRQSKHIPGVTEFRHYLIGRIEQSLNGYREHLLEPDYYSYDVGLPEDVSGKQLLEEKLAVMQSLFTELQMNV